MELGADYVNVANDFNKYINGSRPKKFKLIVPAHNYENTPSVEDLGNLVLKIQSTGADIVKVVTTALDITDVARMFQIPVIGLVMGERGLISRILVHKFGGYLTFGDIEYGKGSASDQPTLKELTELYNFRLIGPKTKYLASLVTLIVFVSSCRTKLGNIYLANTKGLTCFILSQLHLLLTR